MADVTFKLEGLEPLLAKFAAITADVKYKGGRFALRKAAMLIAQKAKENAARVNDPETAESIEKNIAVRWNGRLFKRKGDLGFRVGVMGGARQYAGTRENKITGRAGKDYFVGGDKTNPGGDTFYWRFIEFGTQKIGARPIMRPALADNVTTVTTEFVTHFSKALERAIARAK